MPKGKGLSKEFPVSLTVLSVCIGMDVAYSYAMSISFMISASDSLASPSLRNTPVARV